jgi:hypothetical protein
MEWCVRKKASEYENYKNLCLMIIADHEATLWRKNKA